MIEKKDILKNSVIIGAHPDDEILWFGAILAEVDKVIIVYRDFWAQPDIGEARTAALEDYPRGNVECLGLEEAGTYDCANWSQPVCDEFGLAFSTMVAKRELKRVAKKTLAKVTPIKPAALNQSIRSAYCENYDKIYAALKKRLTPDMNVFTHNPWGEYGHEDHVQLFRILDRLRDEIGFCLWMTNYCTDRAMPLAMQHLTASPDEYLRLPVNREFAEKVADTYKKHNCWTWANDWQWYREECYAQAPRETASGPASRYLIPMNFFVLEPPEEVSTASRPVECKDLTSWNIS